MIINVKTLRRAFIGPKENRFPGFTRLSKSSRKHVTVALPEISGNKKSIKKYTERKILNGCFFMKLFLNVHIFYVNFKKYNKMAKVKRQKSGVKS